MIITIKFCSTYFVSGIWCSLDDISNDWIESIKNTWYLPSESKSSKYSICPSNYNQWQNQNIKLTRFQKSYVIESDKLKSDSVWWYQISRESGTEELGIKFILEESTDAIIDIYFEFEVGKLQYQLTWNRTEWLAHVNEIHHLHKIWAIITPTSSNPFFKFKAILAPREF